MLNSIKHKILIYFNAAAFLTIALLGTIVTWQLNQSFSQQSEQLTTSLTTQVYENLDYPHQTFAMRLRSDIRRVADDVRQIVGMIANGESDQFRSFFTTLQRVSEQEELHFAALFDMDGRFQSSFPSELNARDIEEFFRASEFGSLPQRIRQGETEGTEIWDSLSHVDVLVLKTLHLYTEDIAPQGTMWIAAMSIIKDSFDEPIGFCLVARLLNHYDTILTELHDTGGYASVIYSGDTPIAQAGFGSLGSEAFDLSALSLPQATATNIMEAEGKTLHTLMLAGQNYLMACKPLDSYERLSIGSICIGLPEAQVFATQDALLTQGESTRRQIIASVIQIGLLSIALFTLLSLLIATTIVSPIQRLSHTSKQIAAGNLTPKIPVTSHDEIGELINAFNEMAGNLRDKERMVEDQTAELSAANDQLKGVLEKNTALLQQSNRSEQLLRNVLDNSPELIFAKDSEFRYILVNASYAKSLGKTVEEILGKDDIEIGLPKEYVFGNPEKGIRGFRADDAIVLAGEPVHNTNDIITADDGTTRVFETYKIPLRDENGETFAILGVSHEETEQRRAEQQLRTFHTLTEHSIDTICIVDMNEMFTYANQAAYELFGYQHDQEEMLGMPLTNIWAEDRNSLSLDHIIRHTKAGWWRGEIVMTRKDGSLFDAYLTTFLLRDEQEHPLAMAALVRDISDRKRAEEQLRTVSHYTRSLLESSLDPIITVSPEGVITDVNSATELIIGVAREHLIDSDFAVYFTRQEEATDLYKQAFLKGSIRDFPLVIRHTSGQVTDVLCNATVYKNAEGAVQGVFISARDITDRKRMEEEITKFKTIAEHAQYGVTISDAKGNLEYVNEYFATIHGYALDEVIGQPLTIFHNTEQQQQMFELLRNLQEQGTLQVEEVWHTHKDGHVFPMLMSIMLIRDEAGAPHFMATTAIDITNRKQAEERLRNANQELENANQRLEEASQHKSDFLANMSHELRTPLNAIIGFTSMTITALKENIPEEHLRNLRKSETAARTLMQLISDVLDLSKIEAGEMQTHIEEVYLEDLMDEIIVTTEGLLLEKAITFTCDYPDDMPVVQNDYVKVKQILNNLVSNAVKFTTEGGVTMKTSVLNHPTPNWGVHIEVQDTGCGIPEDKLPTIFESFKQIDGSIRKKFGGTGLGLAITKKFCDSLGIEIGVSSKVDTGTTFWLKIPATYQGLTEDRISMQTAQSSISDFQTFFPKLEHKALILCLSGPATCEILRQHFGRLPLEVQQVSSVEECLEYAQKSPIWSVLVEPDGDRFETIGRLKNEPLFAHVPVILCSIDGDRHNFQQLGPLEYLTKPIEEQELLDVLFRIMKEHVGDILVVDDDENIRDLYRQILTNAGYTATGAKDGLEALSVLERNGLPQAIILDLLMPKMDGFQVLERLQGNDAWQRIPIIVVTGKSLTDNDCRRIREGAGMLLQKDQFSVQELPEHLQAAIHSVILAGSQTILIVDDNQINLDLEASVFRNAGYTVYTADSGEAGISLASEVLPDMILMDLAMPGMDGFEAVQRLKQQTSTATATVIACSAFATKEYQQRAFEAGCEGYITKPVEPNRLVEQVTTYFLASKIRQRIEMFRKE